MTGIFLTQTQQEVVACFSKNKNTRSRPLVPTGVSVDAGLVRIFIGMFAGDNLVGLFLKR